MRRRAGAREGPLVLSGRGPSRAAPLAHAPTVLHSEHGESKHFAPCGHAMREVGDRMLVPTCACYRFEWRRRPGAAVAGERVARIVRNVGPASAATADGVILDREVSANLCHANTQWRCASGAPRQAPFLSRGAQAEAARTTR